MTSPRLPRVLLSALVASSMVLAPAVLLADPPATTPVTKAADSAWDDILAGKSEVALTDLRNVPTDKDDAAAANLHASVALLDANIAKREAARTEQINKVSKELDDALAGDGSPSTLSKALKSAVELDMLTKKDEQPALIKTDRFKSLIERADKAARESETKLDWMMAGELFGRLNLLLEQPATYKADARRINERLAMIRFYAPQRLWELRNARRALEKLPPLPAFNEGGETYQTRLKGVDRNMVLGAIANAAARHVERVPLRTLLIGGLRSVNNMISTADLAGVFPELKNDAAREKMQRFLTDQIADLQARKSDPSDREFVDLIDTLISTSADTVKIDEPALMHEFGNGAFDQLDEFSAIIWPDEKLRFDRLTQPDFTGVGVQIQMDEDAQMIKVVMPLDGTPAQKAGVKPGDYIKKINDKPSLGLSLDQAVEQITGPEGSKVDLTMERDGKDIDFHLVRSKIPLRTVKGWTHAGNNEAQWNWFIDPQNHIGYVRMSGFNADTARELYAALDDMNEQGVQGLIFDLRFNPGGLLDQAVLVANSFISDGLLVYTQGPTGPRRNENANPSRVHLKNVPIAVLINDGSASASEIVSGAMKFYADKGLLSCRIFGERSFGKGSVQNVMELSPDAYLKLTMQYYHLPDGRVLHRRDGATVWGVDPHDAVEMLPKQISEALTLRQDADLPADAKPVAIKPTKGDDGEPLIDPAPKGPPDPNRLINEGIDLQLETALVFLQAKALGHGPSATAAKPTEKGPG